MSSSCRSFASTDLVFYLYLIYFYGLLQQLGHRAADLTIPKDLAVTTCDELAEVLRDISPFITSLVNIPVSQDAGLPPSSTSEVVPPRLSANQSERIKAHEVTWREKQRQLRSSFDK